MVYVDWKLASICVMLLVGVLNVAARRFFERGEDWRIFIPFVLFASLWLLVYLILSYQSIRFTDSGLVLGVALAVMAGLAGLLTMIVYADQTAPLSAAVSIMGMSIVVTAAIGMLLLGEQVTTLKVAGVILGAVSIGLLTWK